MNILDPSKTRASESSLWEITMMKKHYCPQVSKLALIFEDSLSKPSYDLEDFFDLTYKSLMDLELNSKKLLEPIGTKISKSGDCHFSRILFN